MKFGKQLARVIDSSDPEWAPYWVNYKLLKKKLKELPRASFPNKNNGTASSAPAAVTRGAGGGHAVAGAGAIEEEREKGGGGTASEAVGALKQESCCGSVGCPNSTCVAVGGGQAAFNANEQIAALSRSPEEASFFKLINKELQKITQFFISVETQMHGRLNHVRDGMKLIDMDTVLGKDEASWRHLLAACIKLYKDLLRLENYAIVAWTSFAKILKKHDKWTGFCTRFRFMQNVVNKLPFTHYTRTVEMLEEVEGMYQRVHRIRECSQFKCSSLQDEVLFIETIRGINKEVSRIQEEEHKDAGIPPPLSKKQRKEQQQQQNQRTEEESVTSAATAGGGGGHEEEGEAESAGSEATATTDLVPSGAVKAGGTAE